MKIHNKHYFTEKEAIDHLLHITQANPLLDVDLILIKATEEPYIQSEEEAIIALTQYNYELAVQIVQDDEEERFGTSDINEKSNHQRIANELWRIICLNVLQSTNYYEYENAEDVAQVLLDMYKLSE